MSRTFNNTTADNLQRSSSLITAAPVTISAWVNLAAVGAVVRSIVNIRNSTSGLNLNGFGLDMSASETINARTGDGASGASLSVTAGALTAGSWAHVGGVYASSTSRVAWLNGTAATANTTSRVPSGIDSIQIGVQSHSSGTLAQPWRGEIAEVGVWSAALDTAEMTALSKGASPLTVRPQSLVYYWAIVGRDSPEIDYISAGDMTVAGTAVAAHPRIIMPRSTKIRRFRRTAASGYLGEGLTNSILLSPRRLVG